MNVFGRAVKLLFIIMMLFVLNSIPAYSRSLSSDTKPNYTIAQTYIAQYIPFSFYKNHVPTDPCISGNPAIGTSCTSGTIYAGIFDGGKYMITPGDCTDSTTPTCDGTTDSLNKSFRGGSGSLANIAGVEDGVWGKPTSPAFRGDVNTAAIVASGYSAANSAPLFCDNMVYGGYSDWYLPSRSEMTYLYCNSATGSLGSGAPPAFPGCTQLGGRNYTLTGFHSISTYQTSTENGSGSNSVALVWFNGGWDSNTGKTTTRRVRCVRRYGEAQVDEAPDAISWANFNDISTAETISGFDETIFLEFSASDTSGTPNYYARVNDEPWRVFTSSTVALLAVRSGDTVDIRIIGNVTDSGTVTVINATDHPTRPTLDTVVATVTDACGNGAVAIGSTCAGGALFAGVFDGARYMVTPGNCTDSASPTCNGSTDSITKIWRGTGGSDADIAGVENTSSVAVSGSPFYRGDVNTAAAIADASVDSDSAADFCNDMTYGGYSDWYLPSKSEMIHIACNSNESLASGKPLADPDCIQHGGKSTLLTGFAGADYWTSSEYSSTQAVIWSAGSNDSMLESTKSSSANLRCVRRYDSEFVDSEPDTYPSWADFNDISTADAFTAFDETIYVQLSAVNFSGAPTLEYRINSNDWIVFIAGDLTYVPIRANDTLQLKVSGTIGHSADITLRNGTKGASWDMRVVRGTVSDPCYNNPALGTSCTGGALYAGVFDGGKYMVTPGDCTDSVSPTCDGTTDTLTKMWYGTSGADADIAGVENIATDSDLSSPSYRGDVNTAAAVADASVDADSAADFCNNMTYGGYSDWYLPSKSEMVYILCKSNADPGAGYPQEDLNCTQFGGATDDLSSFDTANNYHTSSEYGSNLGSFSVDSSNISTNAFAKSSSHLVRCVRRYEEAAVDELPDSIDWTAFNDMSSAESISGFDETIILELSASSSVGTPTYYVDINSSNAWMSFDDSTARLIAVRSGDNIRLRITGSVSDSGTITIKNATDNASTPTLDTVVATVSDQCGGVPTIGSTCGGGALFAGVFDGGKYMVTPGNCTDSANPTCSGAGDSVTKTFYGTSGSGVDVAGAETQSSVSSHSSPSYRGDVNTAALVADGNIDSDSAADFCNDMNYGGYSDWYLPSKTELAYIQCKGNRATSAGQPLEAPDCVQFGGETDEITGMNFNNYWSSTESTATNAWRVDIDTGLQGSANKSNTEYVRCIRRYDTALVDEEPNGVDWGDFTGTSTAETLSGFDETIFIELTAVNGTGSPTLEYQRNSEGWVTFTAGSSTLIAIRPSDTLAFQASGTSSDDATITVKNATDDANTPILDTVVATAP